MTCTKKNIAIVKTAEKVYRLSAIYYDGEKDFADYVISVAVMNQKKVAFWQQVSKTYYSKNAAIRKFLQITNKKSA